MMSPSRISRTIREQVTDRLRDDVLTGQFEAGTPLREAPLAQRFGVSRGPVRDALLQLTQEGLLVYTPNHGVTVSEPPNPDGRELIVGLRRRIETFSVEKGFDRITDEDLDRWGENVKHLLTACERRDTAAIARCDMAFHQAILQTTSTANILPIWKMLCSQMLLTYSRHKEHMQVYEEHAAILQAFRDGNKPLALERLAENIT